MKFRDLAHLFLCIRGAFVLAGLFIFVVAISAQKIVSVPSILLANPSANIDQCRNGSTGSDPCIGNNWVNGNLGSNNSQYAEDEYVPYRIVFTNLTPGTNYTIVIGYDTVHSSKHAIDYLGGVTDFKILDRTTELAGVRSADPCDNGVTCSGAGNFITIPQDPLVLASINPITLGPVYEPQNRRMVMFGGTPTSIAYTGNVNTGDIERQITVTFTANLATAVLAWSGHVAFGGDWGIGNSAAGIPGSPYHMRIDGFGVTGGDLSGGQMDRSMSADAVTASAFINIIKKVNTVDGSGAAFTSFQFTATANFGVSSFSLVDNVAGTDGVTRQSNAITNFGVGNAVTVNEENTAGWTLAGIVCDVNANASFTSNVPVQPAPHAGSVTITLNPGGEATCTFTNSQLDVTAAPATVSGRIMSANGMPLKGVQVALTDGSTGQTRFALSNPFGYYVFQDCPTEDFYVLSISSKRYTFSQNTRTFTLTDNLADMNFVSDQ